MNIIENMGALGEVISIFYNTLIKHGVSEDAAVSFTNSLIYATITKPKED